MVLLRPRGLRNQRSCKKALSASCARGRLMCSAAPFQTRSKCGLRMCLFDAFKTSTINQKRSRLKWCFWSFGGAHLFESCEGSHSRRARLLLRLGQQCEAGFCARDFTLCLHERARPSEPCGKRIRWPPSSCRAAACCQLRLQRLVRPFEALRRAVQPADLRAQSTRCLDVGWARCSALQVIALDVDRLLAASQLDDHASLLRLRARRLRSVKHSTRNEPHLRHLREELSQLLPPEATRHPLPRRLSRLPAAAPQRPQAAP